MTPRSQTRANEYYE
jgi:hypothetical protein